MHTASWLASTSFVFSPSLASFSLQNAVGAEGRGTDVTGSRPHPFSTLLVLIGYRRAVATAQLSSPPPHPYRLWTTSWRVCLKRACLKSCRKKRRLCGGNVWQGEKKDAIHVCQGCWRNEAMSKPMSKRKKAEELNCFSSLFWSPVFNKTPSEYATLQSRNGDNIPKNFNLNNVRHSHMIYCTCIMSASQLITA